VAKMAEIPYTSNTGKLKDFLSTIRTIGVPSGATQDWFQQIGFKSSNDRPILRVMQYIKFIDSSSKPTDLWRQYRTDNYRTVLAKGIREGYKELFNIYPDANKRSIKEINNFFTSKSSAGKSAINYMISTFNALCELADFNGGSVDLDQSNDNISNFNGSQSAKDNSILSTQKVTKGSGVTVNINIQLTLPDTTDPKVYDNFFAAMKNYLFQT